MIKKMAFLFIVGAGFLVIASINVFANVRLDPNQLQSWNSQSSYPCRKVPFIATYTKNGRTFKFFAADHVFGPASDSDPTLRRIREEIEKFKPGAIVVETSVREGQFSQANLERQDQSCRNQTREFVCGEASYAAIVAARQGAQVFGGERNPRDRNAKLLESGWSREQVQVYNSLLILSSLREEGVSLEERKRRLTSDPRNQSRLLNDSTWSYAKLDNWLRRNGGHSADDVDTSWIEPRSDAQASATQRLAARHDSVREPQILATAERAINSSQNSMMVYGSGHYVKQARALAQVFGPPQIQCLADGDGAGSGSNQTIR